MQVPVADGLFTWPSERPQLIVSRRSADEPLEFPALPGDEQILLSRYGTLYTWTTQEFRPPSPPYRDDVDPKAFQPYAVGYVEFPEGILVEGRIIASDPLALSIGQDMEVVVEAFRCDSDGTTVVTYAFTPIEDLT